MEAESFAKWLATLGTNGAIAAIVIYFYNRLAQTHAKDWIELTERWEKINEDLHDIVKENTAAFTRCTELISAMQRQLDRWDGNERRTQERRQRPVTG